MNIVIIGGSRGIGKAAARELLQDGHKVLIVGRNPKTLEETGPSFQAKGIHGGALLPQHPRGALRTVPGHGHD